MTRRIFYLLKTYVAVVLMFIVAKPIFMYCNKTSNEFSLGDVADVLQHGLTLDLSTSIYFLLFPYLIIILSLWVWRWEIIRAILQLYNIIASIVMGLAVVVDLILYPFWGFKLDASCLDYALTPEAITDSVSTQFIVTRVLILLAVIVLIGIILNSLLPKQVDKRKADRKIVRIYEHKRNAFPVWQRLVYTLLGIALVYPIIVGIRGGLNESTTNVGQVYYSQNQFLNHSAVNPVFSFLSSLEKSVSNNNDYDFFSDVECYEIIGDSYGMGRPGKSPLPMESLLSTKRPNVVIILMESCGGMFTELGGRTDVMPNLNRLAREGIYFTHCIGNTWRTDRGTVCTLSGYPSFPNTSVMKMPSKTRNLPGIAKTLQTEGYSTYYLYGGDINFTNMRSYLIATGWENLTSMDDYSSADRNTAKWGVRDDITFNTLYEMIERASDYTLSGGQKFLIGYSSLSSHEPWDVPIHHFDDEKLNAFYYLDQCIGNFIEKLKSTSHWKDLLIIMVPDHSINYEDITQGNPKRNIIPCLCIGGAVKHPVRIDAICNQTDIVATLLGQMGINHDDFKFSRDVTATSYSYPFAIHTYTEGIELRDSTGYIHYDLKSNRITVRESQDTDRLLNLGKAILQATSKDFEEL